MDDIPPSLLLEILSRLHDSADVARCRVSSRTLNSIAPELRSVHLHCSYGRYSASRSPLTRSSVTPFKDVFNKLISELQIVETVSIGVDKTLREVAYDDLEDEDDDLFLSDVNFVGTWLPRVRGDLKSIAISNFWLQSCWRRSDVLPFGFKFQCNSENGLLYATVLIYPGIYDDSQKVANFEFYSRELLELDIKNAWLSVDGLTTMPKLTTLTLEFIRLDDENLEKLNECFPCLQNLNLIGVGGLKDPQINLMHLRTCKWILSNAPTTVSIVASCLVKLTLSCVKPKLLLIDSPSLSDLSLSFEGACNLKVKEFSQLNKLHLESACLRNVLALLPFGRAVKNLTAVSTKWEAPVGVSKSILELLFCTFPNMTSLTLTSRVWSELEMCPGLGGLEMRARAKGLKEIKAYLTVNDIEVTLSTIFSLLDNCSGLSNMTLFVHRDVVSNVTSSLILRCMAHCVRVRWNWGMWREGTEDVWISNGI
ncbi:F-box family protein [Striga asiatica]|uniref:F-box family protein n=1 Tax=Striga asiatica TaxID=4170 RepID=A0A5A7Q8B6_STRAF|nr:F-box family protein [Striga asiatica]